MKKILAIVFVGLGLAACESRIEESPMEFVKRVTIKDTMDYCMKVNGNRDYCACEVGELETAFPWTDYMAAVDIIAGEENHVAAVIAKHNGNRRKVLEELNCEACVFDMAMITVDVSPSPKCEKFLDK